LIRAISSNQSTVHSKLPKDYGWGKLIASDIKIYDVEASHYELINTSNSGVLANCINNILDKYLEAETDH
jgi:hypothetical protein